MSDADAKSGQRQNVLSLARRMRAGDQNAREQLVSNIYERLEGMTRRMLKHAPSAVVRWDQTGDLLHSAWFRIERALADESIELQDEAHLFRLIARHLRFQLIEVYRRNVGAYGIDANHGSQVGVTGEESRASAVAWHPSDDTNDVGRLVAWGEFHQQVEQLSEREKTVVDLLWYQGLSHEEAATLLGVDAKTVQRAWRRAKITLASKLDPSLLGD